MGDVVPARSDDPRDEIRRLRPDDIEVAEGGAPASGGPTDGTPPAATPQPDPDTTPVMPVIADGTAVSWLDPAAEWAAQVEAVPGSTRFEAGVAARVHLVYDEARADDLRHEEEHECVVFPLSGALDPEAALSVDYDDRDLRPDPPDGAGYVLIDARVDTKTWFTSAAGPPGAIPVADRPCQSRAEGLRAAR